MSKVNKVKIVLDFYRGEILSKDAISVIVGGKDVIKDASNPFLDDCSCIKFPSK